MTRTSNLRFAQGLTALIATLFFTGCAATSPGLDRVKGMSAEQDAIVIGKIRLIKNGKETPLADDMFASTPRIHLTDLRHGRTVRADIGDDGEFAWSQLETGGEVEFQA